MLPPEIRQFYTRHRRMVERNLQRDRMKLFQALEYFANLSADQKEWAYFRRHWPKFFPEAAYDAIFKGSKPSILDYPTWVNGLWEGTEPDPILSILLGIESPPYPEHCESHEDACGSGIAWIPAQFYLDWSEGVFCYEGACDFQRALYLLFRESWRARVCYKCQRKFIASRVAQKYCSTYCSEGVQRELKLKWWAENGENWRRERKASKSRKKGGSNGARQTR